MLRKYVAIVLFAAFTLVACDNGYDERTGEAQTDTGTGADTSGMNDRDTEMGAPREREMDRRTSDIRTRPRTNPESDTGTDFGTNPGTGSVPEGTSPGTSDQDTGMDDTTGGATGNP